MPMDRDWFLIDAKGVVLGRMASFIANLLMGKYKPDYAPHIDKGAGVIVINAKHIKVTGRKLKQKKYFRYSGYPGGIKEITMEKLLAKKPEEVIKHAVRGMLPKNKLRDDRIKRLKVYPDENHKQTAQKPIKVEVGKWQQFTQLVKGKVQ